MQANTPNAATYNGCELACPSAGRTCCTMDMDEIRPRVERLIELQPFPRYICGQQACNQFGGHDYYPVEETTTACKSTRKLGRAARSLGSPVGMVQSSYALQLDKAGPELHVQRFATYLKAFAMIYLTPETEWDSNILDMLLREGQLLYTSSVDPNRKTASTESLTAEQEIYSEDEAKIQREFELNNYTFRVDLSERFQPGAPGPGMKRAYDEVTAPLLRDTLKVCFGEWKYCLMRISAWYLLVWRTRGVFFVFDFYGRRPNDFCSERNGGVAMLICLKSLDNVAYLVESLSEVSAKEPIVLRELRVVKLAGPGTKTVIRDCSHRSNQYEVVSEDYAVLASAYHLNRGQRDPVRSRAALPIAVAALITAKIDHPATWNREVVERIICFGVNVCQETWEICQIPHAPIELERFPSELKLGQFHARYTLTSRCCEGVWKCVPNYAHTELAICLQKCFDNGLNNLIVQVGSQLYAFWKKHGYFYLLDPYRHRVIGKRNGDMTRRTASVRMFRSLEGFMYTFTQLLLEFTKTTPFQVHSLKLNMLQYVDKPEGRVALIEEVPMAEDVRSLNETIHFDEDFDKCKSVLTEITEEDDEEGIDGALQMDTMEPKSDSEQSSEDVEEEEGGIEGLGEYESESSGDDQDPKGGGRRQGGGSDRASDRPSKSRGSKSSGGSSKRGSKGRRDRAGSSKRSAGNGKAAAAHAKDEAAAATAKDDGKTIQVTQQASESLQSFGKASLPSFGKASLQSFGKVSHHPRVPYRMLSDLFSLLTLCRPAKCPHQGPEMPHEGGGDRESSPKSPHSHADHYGLYFCKCGAAAVLRASNSLCDQACPCRDIAKYLQRATD